MAYNHTKLEQRLSDCDRQLSELFTGLSPDTTLQGHIKSVQEYYNLSYKKAKNDKVIEEIIASYELYVEQLGQVKAGTLSRDEAEETVGYANDSRKIAVIFSDLFKVCELIFWAAASVTLFAAAFSIALPVLIVQPTLGVAISITIGALLFKAAMNAIQNLTEFRFFGRHNAEYVSEVSLLKFFKPQRESTSASNEPIPTDDLVALAPATT